MMRNFLRLLLLSILAVLAWAGNAPALAAYTDNGDGTVTDAATGLMWDKCSLGQNNDAGCSDDPNSADTYTWQQALASAVTANAGNYKGHNDWRLPNAKELESIVKIDASSPAIDGTAFPNTASRWYWSSTFYTPNSTYAWVVDFSSGFVYPGGKPNIFHVRLVRGGQSPVSFDALAAAPAPVSATPIPTLSEWGLIILSLLLAGMAASRLRRG